MKLYDSHYDFQTGKCYSEEVGETITYKEKWEELKSYLEVFEKFERDDYGRGWNHAIGAALEKMKALEEEE